MAKVARARVLAVVAVYVLLAGCDAGGKAAPPAPSPSASRAPERPAALAGGVCQLWDYPMVEGVLGVRFTVAVATQLDTTQTCLIQVDASDPSLALSASPTRADADVYAKTVVPKGATAVTGLGKAAYRIAVPPAGAGPAVEVGWLSPKGWLYVLRYTAPAGTPPADLAPLGDKLVELGKRLDPA